jgi:crotonobetainyl-CoA:carnitine CoA-transferase CaiB-like acyl-CoA transferase
MTATGITSDMSNLTETLRSNLNNPVNSSDFDLYTILDKVLSDVGLSQTDSGGKLTFYGKDPIVPSRFRFGSMAAIALAAKGIAVASIWKFRSGEGQDIHVDVRKALQRFAGFFDLKWELINGRPPSLASDPQNPFLQYPPMTLWNKTRDGRWVMPCNYYPKLRAGATTLLRCDDSVSAVQNAMLQWRAEELETAAAEAGLPFAMLRTTEEFMKELQYTEVLSREPLIRLEKIGESDPVPLKPGGKTPLDGVRALGMGHVIAGPGIGRDLALFGADVLNIWQPLDWELEMFYWTSHVGMRSTILDLHEKADLEKMNQLLNDADIFFSNRRPGYQERFGLTADELCSKHPGLIHAKVTLFGETGPWSNRAGFDEVAGAVMGVFALEGTPDNPRLTPLRIVCDYVGGWLASVGIMSALRRRAIEGGSYRVVVSLARVTLWLLSLGIFDKKFALSTAGSSDEHTYIPPDLFTAETSLGLYQGITEQMVMSKTPGSFRTVLVPRGSSKPEWL